MFRNWHPGEYGWFILNEAGRGNRDLGARRSVVLATVLIEAILPCWRRSHRIAPWHGTVGLIGPWIATNAGVTADFYHTTAELLLVPFLIVLDPCSIITAVAAYRTTSHDG